MAGSALAPGISCSVHYLLNKNTLKIIKLNLYCAPRRGLIIKIYLDII